MARITRSQVDMSEKSSYQPSPLAELDFSKAGNTPEDAVVASELKGLKAAYRGALGIAKRGKKARNKKRDQQIVEVLEYNDTSSSTLRGDADMHNQQENIQLQQYNHTPTIRTTRQQATQNQVAQTNPPSVLVPIQDTSALAYKIRLAELEKSRQNPPPEQLPFPRIPAPNIVQELQVNIPNHASTSRTTRQQAAQEKAIQSNLPDVMIPRQDASALAQHLRDLDYVSLFPGPYTRPSAVSQLATGDSADRNLEADQVIHLEEELKTLRQNTPQQQFPNANTLKPDVVQQDHFSTPIPLKSPVKTLAEVEETYGSVDAPVPAETEDSFVEQITSRSPAKPVTRIEDSLEALDQLEEALEAIGEAALANRIVSTASERAPIKSHTPKSRVNPLERSKSLRATKTEPVVSTLRKANTILGNTTKQGSASMRTKLTAPKNTPLVKRAVSLTSGTTNAERKQPKELLNSTASLRASVKRPTSLLPPKETVKSTKPLTRPTFELSGEAIARKLKEQREARVAQRSASEGSPPPTQAPSERHKSSKPATKAVFELSGAALSLKKKEALEARLKFQENEERQRREFKAKPIRKSVVPDYASRGAATSRARQSKMGLEASGDLRLPQWTPSNGSNIGARRPPVQPLAKANVSVLRTKPTAPNVEQAVTTHGPSMSGKAMPRTVTLNDLQVQRQKAKEIYGRDAKWTEDMGRERREREAAAKRAREEAAERGRQASREWAEKQMARKMTGDVKLSPGFGPGGQMGLRA